MADGGPGRTRSAGWEVGVRRTGPVAVDAAWAVVVERLDLIFGPGAEVDAPAAGAELLQGGRRVGSVVSWQAGLLRVRLEDWAPAPRSIVQVRVLPAATGSTIALHHERLADAAARERLAERWTGVVEELVRLAS